MKHTDTLLSMFSAGYAEAQQGIRPDFWEKGAALAMWHDYQGPECDSFKVYMRYRKDHLIIANISAPYRGTEPAVRKGRMPLILAALYEIAPLVTVESVVSPQLRTYLEAIGFKAKSGEDPYTLSRGRE